MLLSEKEIEREFRLACVKACETRGYPKPKITVMVRENEETDDLLSLGHKMLDEMTAQGIVWMYEEAIGLAASAIHKRMQEGVVWDRVVELHRLADDRALMYGVGSEADAYTERGEYLGELNDIDALKLHGQRVRVIAGVGE